MTLQDWFLIGSLIVAFVYIALVANQLFKAWKEEKNIKEDDND